MRPFSDYIGKTVTLNRPVILVKEGRGILGNSDVSRVQASPFVILETDGCANTVEAIQRKEYEKYNSRHPEHAGSVDKGIELLAGQLVTITKVSHDLLWDREEIIAYGTVKPPQFPHEINFAYGWSSSHLLAPAPWEPAGTPPIRRWLGTPPGNIDSLVHVSADTPTWGEPGVPK